MVGKRTDAADATSNYANMINVLIGGIHSINIYVFKTSVSFSPETSEQSFSVFCLQNHKATEVK